MSLSVENPTPLVLQPLFLTDADGTPTLVSVIKATFRLDRRQGNLPRLAEKQLPVELAGKSWGTAGQSSYIYEPEVALTKPGTDVVVIGHAVAPRGGTTEMDVRLRVGTIDKMVRVCGDRQWVKRMGIVDMTNPRPFERIPLIWERAFGGWSSPERDPLVDRFEPRNPVGVGFRVTQFREGMPLPNIENPRYRLQQYGQTPPPASFGFVAPNWQPRAAWAGTYDAAWMRDRAPLLPRDFNPRFYQAAPDDQIIFPHLKGGEPFEITGMHASGPLACSLPSGISPECLVTLRGGKVTRLIPQLDTVIFNLDEDLIMMLWRAHIPLSNGPHDVLNLTLGEDAIPKYLARE